MSPYTATTSITIGGNTGLLVKTDVSSNVFVFTKWNTAANGSGTNYGPGYTTTYDTSNNPTPASLILYAQWSPGYSMAYNGNGNTSGSAPTDASSPYLPSSSVTVKASTGLLKTGYVFTRWNTDPSGNGTSYSALSTFAINANTLLYAQWGYSVTYNGNTSTGGSVPVDASSPYNPASSVSVLGNIGSLVKTGFTFNGWNTAANGSGTPYSPANTFTINVITILYAQWI
jgi:hypothetical protein